MLDVFDPVSLIKAFGYLGLFSIIFAESGILLGLFLPGDSLLFTAGFLASQDYLRVEILMPLLLIAAFAGDSVGYLFGKKVGPKVFSQPKSLWFNPENVERTRRFFERYGAKTIVLARFIPIVRTFAPVMAGVGEMKYKTFVLYNFIGAFLWAVGVTAAGYFFGNIIPNADRYVLPVVFLIILTSLAPPLRYFYKEKRKKE
ncbi:MAG: VTT domain-containing protein [Candidatus Zambryskibacteria bacterium]|nr:VTT domain-containing protein [Candidatus Zambryskibacteria bacterium]